MPAHSFTTMDQWRDDAKALLDDPTLAELIPGVNPANPFLLASLVAVQEEFLRRYPTYSEVPADIEDRYLKFLGEASTHFNGGDWTTVYEPFGLEPEDLPDRLLGIYIPGSMHRGVAVADNWVGDLYTGPIAHIVDAGALDMPYPSAEEIAKRNTDHYHEGFILVSAVIIHNDAGDILLVRKRGTNSFMFPGGKPEQGEEYIDAAIRECQEEIGVTFPAEDLQFWDTVQAPAANEADMKVTALVYVARTPLTGTITPTAEIEEIRWVDLAQDLKAQCAPYHVAPLLKVERLGFV